MSPTGNPIPQVLPVDERLCWIMGYYAAEGSCGRHQVSFASSAGEPDLHSAVAGWAAGIGVRAGCRTSGGSTSVTVGSVTLRNWFKESFGSGPGKRLPVWVERLPQGKQWAVLTGYLAGDGHYGSAGVRSSTISRHLATQLYEISCRLGLPVRMRCFPKKLGRPQWHLQWSLCASAVIVDRTPSWMVAGKQFRWGGAGAGVADQTHVRFVGGRLVARVRSVEKIDGPVDVFNLAVDEDESYVAEGTVVHNCVSYGVYLLQHGNAAGTMAPHILGGTTR